MTHRVTDGRKDLGLSGAGRAVDEEEVGRGEGAGKCGVLNGIQSRILGGSRPVEAGTGLAQDEPSPLGGAAAPRFEAVQRRRETLVGRVVPFAIEPELAVVGPGGRFVEDDGHRAAGPPGDETSDRFVGSPAGQDADGIAGTGRNLCLAAAGGRETPRNPPRERRRLGDLPPCGGCRGIGGAGRPGRLELLPGRGPLARQEIPISREERLGRLHGPPCARSGVRAHFFPCLRRPPGA